MSETRQLLALCASAEAANDDWALATVVRVAGSTYRKPGARMLLTRSGQRSGMVSGGCLEAEITKKIWWLTKNGPIIQRYSTFFDDDGNPAFGLGCGGTVDVLLERSSTARAALQAIQASVEQRSSAVLLTVVESDYPELPTASHFLFPGDAPPNAPAASRLSHGEALEPLRRIAAETAQSRASAPHYLIHQGKTIELFAEFLRPPFHLFLFGAGDDAQPLAALAHTLGWRATVADGRANLLRPERFPTAEALANFPSEGPLRELDPTPHDGAVLMTHSYAQDRALLKALLPRSLAYLGVLGPRRRTLQIIEEIAPELGFPVAQCMSVLHAPVGLDIADSTPTTIALSIAAEIQSTLHARAAVPSTVNR